MVTRDFFDRGFRALTSSESHSGYAPLQWQRRLFERFCDTNIPSACDLPTGLGKTSVIHIWLLALAHQLREGQPRTVPLRLAYVVDRRTVVDQATSVAELINENVQKNAWLFGPLDVRLAVSTLRGRLADNREWTRDISQPAIVIGTVDMIGSRLLFSGYRSSYKRRPLEAGLLGQDALIVLDEAHLSKPFAQLTRWIEGQNPRSLFVMHMSATGEKEASTFGLEPCDLEGDRDSNPVLRRYEAIKRVTIHENVADLQGEMLKTAGELAKDGSRVVIFVRSPDLATRLGDKLDARKTPVATLTGTMRGWERDRLLRKESTTVEARVMQRFLVPANKSESGPAILVSTSAGEVGFDLNADHLVCDAAPLDSMIQRLGRVNRRGDGTAQVHVFVEKRKREDSTLKKITVESASILAIDSLKRLPKIEAVKEVIYDGSPKAFSSLERPKEALSPNPEIVEATDVLLDAWSMTSITKPMPGRPAVGPWLRGIEDEAPQTTIVWRSELDLEGFCELESDAIEDWFDAHRVLPHETLSVTTGAAIEWIADRCSILLPERGDLLELFCLIDRGTMELVKLSTLADLDKKGPARLANALLILPSSFGGIDARGLLNAKTPRVAEDASAVNVDIADIRAEPRRMRELWSGESKVRLASPLGANTKGLVRFVIDLPSGDDESQRQLVSFVPKRELFGSRGAEQSLEEHVALVEKQAGEIASRLRIEGNIREALGVAATRHDRGKDRGIWQIAVGWEPGKPILGKSAGVMKRAAGGYRHEFGSIRELESEPGMTTSDEVFDLAAHMIATHHGRGRPHFSKGGFDPLDRRGSPKVAMKVIRRFARLQRKYGHWRLAWIESLLRCADALASTENDEGVLAANAGD